MINSVAALEDFLNGLPSSVDEPNLYIDLEGNNLSRHGRLSLITILVEPCHTLHLIDVHVLGKDAFTVADLNGTTLRHILESANIPKVFFDIRTDSDALFHLFDVRVAGIEDLQLMELGARKGSKRLVKGLARCIEQDAPLSPSERDEWKAAKDKGKALFSPERGGSYEVFDQRPLSAEVEKYCIQDVVHMPALWKKYHAGLNETWKIKVAEETKARIELSQSAEFVGNGKHMAEGPAAWQYGQHEYHGRGTGSPKSRERGRKGRGGRSM